MKNLKPITLAMTGASGMPYGLRLLQYLLQANYPVYLLVSQAAQVVSSLEMDLTLPGKISDLREFIADYCQSPIDNLHVFGQQQWTAPIASGSNITDAMVVCPCTSGCIAAIASGASNNLLERAADVILKEGKQLILVPRETPLSALHLENMLKLSRLGATILPASPGFYHKPKAISDLVDFIVARILDHLKVPHELLPVWGVIKTADSTAVTS